MGSVACADVHTRSGSGDPPASRRRHNPSCTALGNPFPRLHALHLHWPAGSRSPGAALHAKSIVVDGQVALVGGANLTSRAMESNLECGILIRGGLNPEPYVTTSPACTLPGSCTGCDVLVQYQDRQPLQ